MATSEGHQLRTAIAALHPVKCRRRYSDELKRRVVAHTRRRLASGETLAGVAESLDIAQPTLARFLSEVRALVPVEVIEDAGPPPRTTCARMTVRGPAGLVIEGASIEDVAALFKRLSSCSA